MPNEAEKGKGQISVFDLIQRLMTKVKELKLKEPDKFHLLEKSLSFGKKKFLKDLTYPPLNDPEWPRKIGENLYGDAPPDDVPSGIEFLIALDNKLKQLGYKGLYDLLSEKKEKPKKTGLSWFIK